MNKRFFPLLLSALPVLGLNGCGHEDSLPPLANHQQLASTYYGADSAWYMENIPFFECSDKSVEEVYYYRWKLYKAHIRNVGTNKFIITEFINHVDWDRDPYCTINAASMHHIYEGRWLKDDRYVNGYIDYLFQQGGNNRRYSESVADAAFANFLVNGDTAFLTKQLDSMKAVFDGWHDHYDSSKKMYYIPAMPDATEYTIASIDASGGTAGFDGGDAFRPTINSYMFGNARAIARVAAIKGDRETELEYSKKATETKNLTQQFLWNDSMQHFIDRYKQDNQFVHYWDFIRGRELAGFAPWYFNMPDDNPIYHQAWKHIIDTSRLQGAYGFRTNEPSYEHYFKQFIWFGGQRGSQWNGPSWPYQSSQALTGMANMLNDYEQDVITAGDYVQLLRKYARQHYLPSGKINLVENYDPNLGGPIVYYYWSNHYLHSTFNNLVISGLCGVRAAESDTLTINPLVDDSIKYFCLSDLKYHGRKLTMAYDKDGSRYHAGKGISVWVDGKKQAVHQRDGKSFIVVKPAATKEKTPPRENLALNFERKPFPKPSSSVALFSDTSLYQAVDGRIWYFPEITNYWSTRGSMNETDWLAIDFGQKKKVSELKLYLFTDDKEFFVPEKISISYHDGAAWMPIAQKAARLLGNTVNTLQFEPVEATAIRVTFHRNKKQVAVGEIECYTVQSPAPQL